MTWNIFWKEFSPAWRHEKKLRRSNADKISLNRQVETLTNQRDNFKRQLAETQENFNRREEELRTAFNRELDKAKQRILDMQDDFRQESNDLKADLKAANEARQIAEDTANFYRKTYGELDAAYKMARDIKGPDASLTCIPNGISVVVRDWSPARLAFPAISTFWQR